VACDDIRTTDNLLLGDNCESDQNSKESNKVAYCGSLCVARAFPKEPERGYVTVPRNVDII